jgi:lipopolysaccharide/colanic/teichoic acid biosynthesis glycosyltransferase
MPLTDYKDSTHSKLLLRPTVSQSPAKHGVYRRICKPWLDRLLIVLALPLIVPAISVIALLAMLDGGKPFYTQLRVGHGGKTFRMWKIRTMVPDADEQLKSYLAANPAAQAEWVATQKLKSDPRITPIGHFLRKTSLDELPQLFNVMGGTMSLVGPRPMILKQKMLYHGETYFQLSPGITGLWQISGRNNCDFIDRVHYDDVYGKKMSLTTDLRILFKTVAVVLRGTGC